MKKIPDELISDSRAKPHEAGFASAVSYYIRELEDVPRAVDPFRIKYKRLKARKRRRERYQSGECANNDVGKRMFLPYTQKAVKVSKKRLSRETTCRRREAQRKVTER